jgi:hypothetical protein
MSAEDIPATGSIYGLIAEFPSADALVAAVRDSRAAGYRKMDAYAPFPREDLADALELPPSRIPYIMFGGALAGCALGLGMQYYAYFVSYPVNIGGRPLNSWPAFIPATVELTILFAVLSGLLSLFFSLHLPAVYHPVFNHPDFRRASRDGFFLCIEQADRRYDAHATASFLRTLDPLSVITVDK